VWNGSWLFSFLDPNAVGKDYDKNVKNGILSYDQADFSGPEIPMTLSLPHEIISPNPLQNSRFYEKDGKILLVHTTVCHAGSMYLSTFILWWQVKEQILFG